MLDGKWLRLDYLTNPKVMGWLSGQNSTKILWFPNISPDKSTRLSGLLSKGQFYGMLFGWRRLSRRWRHVVILYRLCEIAGPLASTSLRPVDGFSYKPLTISDSGRELA